MNPGQDNPPFIYPPLLEDARFTNANGSIDDFGSMFDRVVHLGIPIFGQTQEEDLVSKHAPITNNRQLGGHVEMSLFRVDPCGCTLYESLH